MKTKIGKIVVSDETMTNTMKRKTVSKIHILIDFAIDNEERKLKWKESIKLHQKVIERERKKGRFQ